MTAHPTGVGPPPMHTPFTDPKRRSADEAFSPSPVVIVAPDSSPAPESRDKMQVDGEEKDVSTEGSGSGSERPTRRLRVASPGSGRTSHASTASTPPTTASPHTPDDIAKPGANEKGQPDVYDSGKTTGPLTTAEIQQDEGLVPPGVDRPRVGLDPRGFVGREVGGWHTIWNGYNPPGAAVESMGATPAMGGNMMMGMGSSWLWTPPPGMDSPVAPLGSASPAPMNALSLPRSTAPPSARPFDFSDSALTPSTEVNAFINPHARPSTPGVTARPFDFGPTAANDNHGSTPASPPRGSSSTPRVTHVPFAPAPPVSHTYVTFGAGASQKEIDAFCAAHPLAAVVANPDLPDGVDGIVDGVVDGKRPTIIADSARPELYERPTATGFGPGSGSFFVPGMGPTSPSPQIPYFVPFAAHPVGSSVMLLGGFGFLSRLRGLSMDCLVEAEVVLPDGRIVWVSKEGVRGEDGELWEEEDAGEGWDGDGQTVGEGDAAGTSKGKEREHTPVEETKSKEEQPKPKRGLWWALRGAGPAFGVVVRYKARAFPVPVVFAGNLIYNFNRLTAASLIKHFRDCIKAAPRELYANCILTAGPKNKGALVVIQICYAGSRAEGLPFLQAISSWEGEGCLLNEVHEKEFVWQQDSIAKVLKGGSGRKWFIRSDLISSLTDEIIHRTVGKFADTPDGCTWLFELSGGALTDTTDSCLPQAAREAAFTVVALHQWKLEENDPACVLTAEEWIREALLPQSTGGPFPCFLERREKRSRILGVYGRENWARLCALKRKYDPKGLFKHNFWPLDEEGRPVIDPKLVRPGEGGEKTSGHLTDLTLDDRGVPLPV
ncbi:hypothetical protein FRC08_010052 [Ceratobasidium sp. 394]|nr:hypothetical protein FRC08_010052 [Ceratobasidium sp. 394]